MIPMVITCIECGGKAHRLPLDEGDFAPGDIVPFTCEDCYHRHDIVVEADDQATIEIENPS